MSKFSRISLQYFLQNEQYKGAANQDVAKELEKITDGQAGEFSTVFRGQATIIDERIEIISELENGHENIIDKIKAHQDRRNLVFTEQNSDGNADKQAKSDADGDDIPKNQSEFAVSLVVWG